MSPMKTKKTITDSTVEERPKGENLDVEWGQTHQERILEKPSRSESARNNCKGRHCDTAFDKL